jgi:hypothetical protein
MNRLQGISEKRIVSFLRHIKDHDVTAIELINDELDKGHPLSEILSQRENGYGYSFFAKKLSENKYIIEFGCQAGPLAGDGGEWEVTFDDQDNVVLCKGSNFWIS